MKRLTTILIAILSIASLQAQTAKQVLDKTAATVGRKGGASASFSISSPNLGTSQGTIAIKGNQFKATTPDAVIWYDGKTQWTYMASTEEVNITTPTKNQQAALNPYTFINLYKEGFSLSQQVKGNHFVITMKAQDAKRSIQQMVVTIQKDTYVPSQVKMLQGGEWTTISISNFKPANQPDGLFTFNAKDYPDAEVIDLR